MAKVEIYTWEGCPYCRKAKDLLASKGVDFIEHKIDRNDKEARDKTAERAGGRTSVPQIFIDDRHIGGCDDLHQLDAEGKLDPLLKNGNGNDNPKNGMHPA